MKESDVFPQDTEVIQFFLKGKGGLSLHVTSFPTYNYIFPLIIKRILLLLKYQGLLDEFQSKEMLLNMYAVQQHYAVVLALFQPASQYESKHPAHPRTLSRSPKGSAKINTLVEGHGCFPVPLKDRLQSTCTKINVALNLKVNEIKLEVYI